MNEMEKCLKLYPEIEDQLTPDGPVQFINRGSGPEILRWDHPTIPRPTKAQLNGVANAPFVSKKRQRDVAQDAGIKWKGHTIQLHRDDAIVMLQVKAAFDLGANSTVAEFANGEKVPITAAEFPALAQQFVTARNALFGGS